MRESALVRLLAVTRLQKFRAFLAALNPSADPSDALGRGFYVEPPGGGVAERLARSLELEPTSSHLVLGGIGSGKTTELLRTQARLEANFGETNDLVFYCDVSEIHDLTSEPEPGLLLAIAGKYLSEAITTVVPDSLSNPDIIAHIRKLRELSVGHYIYIPDYDDFDPNHEPPDEDYDQVFVPGVIKPPAPLLLHHRVAEYIDPLASLLAHLPERNVVFLFDSLDRLPDAASFKILVEDDIRALKSAGFGIVVVGPVRFVVGLDRSVADLFDKIHHQPSVDPTAPDGMAFLSDILRRRVQSIALLLPEDCIESLVVASGGVLRDLLALTKRSAEEAYARGHDPISGGDVEFACDSFGRSLAFGLDDEQIHVLVELANTGKFVIRGERELSLLETRRVLLHPSVEPQSPTHTWRVHPTLKPLLEAIPRGNE